MGKDHCPKCNKLLDAATDANGVSIPDPGDLSICFYCHTMLKFSDDMALRELTEIEFEALPVDEKRMILKAQLEIINFHINEKKK